VVRVRQRLGKYRIDRRLADGGFATVFKAYDTIAGVSVALKVPNGTSPTKEALDDFRKEVRVTAKLDHPNILPVKDAGFIDGVFVIACPLGERSLADRLQHRMSSRTIVELAEQMLAAVAFAHGKRVMHCDIKPENFILFSENRLRLADFGIAKTALRTIQASGSGTVGYVAPEQAMGRPSLRSDVFSRVDSLSNVLRASSGVAL
jgi:serine/threonine protein kinase